MLLLEHRELLTVTGPVPEQHYTIPIGKASVVRTGTDATVVALAQSLHRSLGAVDELAESGISIELIDPRSVAPLDTDTILNSVAKTGRLLVVDEAFAPFGLGAEIAAHIVDQGFDELDSPIKRLNGAHAPIPYSPTLEEAVVPQVKDITHAIQDLLEE